VVGILKGWVRVWEVVGVGMIAGGQLPLHLLELLSTPSHFINPPSRESTHHSPTSSTRRFP